MAVHDLDVFSASGRDAEGEMPAIRAELEGSPWITGAHMFLIGDDDPF